LAHVFLLFGGAASVSARRGFLGGNLDLDILHVDLFFLGESSRHCVRERDDEGNHQDLDQHERDRTPVDLASGDRRRFAAGDAIEEFPGGRDAPKIERGETKPRMHDVCMLTPSSTPNQMRSMPSFSATGPISGMTMNDSSKKSRKKARTKIRMLTTIRNPSCPPGRLVSRCSTQTWPLTP